MTQTPIASQRHVGTIGVDVFFVLSGFIVTRSALTPSGGGEFLRRRWERVAPAYWISSAPWMVVALIEGKAIWPALFTTLTFWPAGVSGWIWPFNGVGWTLSFEMLFYLAVAAVVGTGRRGLVVAAMLLAGCWYLQHLRVAPVFNFLGSPLIAEFLAGVTIAVWWRNLRPLAGAAALALGAAAIVLWTVLGCGWVHDAPTIVAGGLGWFRVLMFGLPAAALVWGALQHEDLFGGRWARPFVKLGDASYSLYLTHSAVLEAVAWCSTALHIAPLTAAGLGLALSVPVALLAYRFVEQPLLRFLRQPKKLVLAPAE